MPRHHLSLSLAIAVILNLLSATFAIAAGPSATPVLSDAPVSVSSDIVYRPDDPNAHLDVYTPANLPLSATLPTVIWTHGGAWIGGDKIDHADYYASLAAHGYTVVVLDYALGPKYHYPLALTEINNALTFLQTNAPTYHIDTTQLILAGDSAGAQITSQIATVMTDPAYAAQLNLTPALAPDQIRAVVLYCGIFDIYAFLANSQFGDGIGALGANTVISAYLGVDSDHPRLTAEMSTIDHVTPAFPPTYISGGNGDPLTGDQSVTFADKLTSLEVPVTTLFFSPDHTPALGHEYQFLLDTPDARQALVDLVAFLDSVTAP